MENASLKWWTLAWDIPLQEKLLTDSIRRIAHVTGGTMAAAQNHASLDMCVQSAVVPTEEETVLNAGRDELKQQSLSPKCDYKGGSVLNNADCFFWCYLCMLIVKII